MKKLIIEGSKVRRLSEPTNWIQRVKSQLTARNLIGLAGIVAFMVWMMELFIGGR